MNPHVPSKFSPIILLLLSLANPAVITLVTAQDRCFEDRAELKYAIDVCFEGGYGDKKCHTDTYPDGNECNRVKATYGATMNSWCVGQVTDMHFLFVEKKNFNEDISDWDTSNVVDLYEIFSYAESFNRDLSRWDTSKVKKMFGTFNNALKFNGDISTWDTSSVTDMQWMFYGAEVFDGDLSQWDVSSVVNMYESFCYAEAFTSDLSNWDISSVDDMGGLFYGAHAFNSDLSRWNTEKVWGMKEVFFDARSFNSDLSSWDFSSLEDGHQRMFNGALAFNQNLCAWKDRFTYDDAKDIFLDSGCAYQNDPEFDDQGPFCASDCTGPIPSLTGAGGALPSSVETEPVGALGDTDLLNIGSSLSYKWIFVAAVLFNFVL